MREKKFYCGGAAERISGIQRNTPRQRQAVKSNYFYGYGHEEMSDDEPTFPKQRRNLILVSSLILFYELGNISSNGSVHLPIIDATINEPAVINSFLHALLTYFFYRYYVMFREHGGNRKIWDNSKSELRRKMQHYAWVTATENLKGKIRDDSSASLVKNPLAIDKKSKDPIKQGAEYYFDYVSNEGKLIKMEQPIVVKGFRLNKMKITTYINDFFLTNIFLEYYFPFLMCIAAVLESFDLGFGKHIVKYLNW